MRKVHGVTRPADTELYRLLSQNAYGRGMASSTDPEVTARALALIRQGADIHYRPPGSHFDRGPIILAAARTGTPELVAAILERGADIEGPGSGSNTPLMAAVRSGNSAVAALLIRQGADPENPRYRPSTPLIEAVRQKDHKTAKALLASGADADFHPKDSAPPLFHAARAGDPKLMTLLLDAGADPKTVCFLHRSAMVAAVEAGCPPCLKLLIDAGGRPVGSSRRGESVLTMVLENNQPEMTALLREHFNRKGDTQTAVGTFEDLFIAVREKRWNRLKALLDLGVEPDIANKNQETLLTLIAARKIWRPDDPKAALKAVTLLLDAGADINAADQKGTTPLNLAARTGALEMVRLLIDRGGDINAATTDGRSPLLNAQWKGHTKIVALLLDAGADPDTRTRWGENSDYPLKVAVGRGDADMVRLLLARGIKLKSGSTEVCDLLQRAASDPETIEALAGSGVDLNRQDSRGRYPLAVVLYHGHPDSIKALLDAGARPVLENWRGHQPLIWFAEKGQVSLLRHALETYPDLQSDSELLRDVTYRAIRKGQVAAVRELLNYGTFFTRIAEVEALVKWTTPPPEFPGAKKEILALFKKRLPAAPPKQKKRTSPVFKLVPSPKGT